MTWRGIEQQFKGSVMGLLWMILQPLCVFSVYVIVFGYIFSGKFRPGAAETGTQYAIGVFLGLTLIQPVIEVLGGASQIIIGQPNFVKKVVFPLEILPAALVLGALFRCAVSLLIIILFQLVSGILPSLHIIWLAPILVCTCLYAQGLAWALAGLGVYIRDLSPLTQLAAIVTTFMSATFYSLSSLPSILAILRFNPLAVANEAARNAAIWHQSPAPSELLILGVSAVLCLTAGAYIFGSLKRDFSDFV